MWLIVRETVAIETLAREATFRMFNFPTLRSFGERFMKAFLFPGH